MGKENKKIQVECPVCDIVRRRMRRESGDQIMITSEWPVKGATAGAKSEGGGGRWCPMARAIRNG